MIIKKYEVKEADYLLEGLPLVSGIRDKQANGVHKRKHLPFSFLYNGSWRVSHLCSGCGKRTGFGADPSADYLLIDKLFTRFHSEAFLNVFADVFGNAKLFRPKDSEYTFLTRSTFNDPEAIDLYVPQMTFLHYNCHHCQADFICQFRQGYPIEPDKANPAGKLGMMAVDRILNVKVESPEGFGLPEIVKLDLKSP
ncbi:hypothetical protein FUAX_44800 (plasmid) [Fulvitalea axinellae]|uniref:Uncharacterized protein n=1 Tax=Fulvitalea axinellae TaxID=1182444 RepID=A0AAU9CVK8_9BACT|nr:hypothetical protein FUAX_44800 [Fulvitalea axinellae]